MTDDLATLLRHEADALHVPGAPAYDIVSAGQRRRRRRRAARAVVAAGLVTTVGIFASGLSWGHHSGSDHFEPADAGVLSGTEPTFTAKTIRLTPQVSVTLEQRPVIQLYSSAGLVVLTSPPDDPHQRPPYHLSLINAQGTRNDLGVTLSTSWVSAEYDQPYVAWAVPTTHGFEVVVRDLTTGRDVAQVPVDVRGRHPMPSHHGLVISLDGDTVYATAQGGGYAIDWRTGDVTDAPLLSIGRVVGVHGGRVLDYQAHQVKDVATGRLLLDIGPHGNGSLSPDGRYVLVTRDSGAIVVYDVQTGTRVRMSATFGVWGWTPDGRPLGLVSDDSRLVTCDPVDGDCTGTAYPSGRQLALPGESGYAVQIGVTG
jgi:hypothetical protein